MGGASEARTANTVVVMSNGGRVALADANSLNRVGPWVHATNSREGQARSPNGRLAAFGTHERSSIAIVDLVRGRRLGRLRTAATPPVQEIFWPRHDRLVVVMGLDRDGSDVIVANPLTRRVLWRRHVGAEVTKAAVWGDRVVVLLGPAGGIGTARVAILERTGMREIRLADVRGGFDRLDAGDPHDELARNRQPGLALDARAGIAYVVPTEDRSIVMVDLAAGTVSRHALTTQAHISKELESVSRHAVWLGGGRLAVGGIQYIPRGKAEPYGLWLVDVTAWTQRRIDPTQSEPIVGSGRVLNTSPLGGGLEVRDRQSHLVGRVLRGKDVFGWIVGRHAFACVRHGERETNRCYSVDLARGRLGPRVTRTPFVVL